MSEVLPGFEDEVLAEEAEKALQRELRRQAASDPAVTGPDKDGHYTLTRTHPWEEPDGTPHKAVTVIFTDAEYAVLENFILAELGLTRATHP